MGKSLLLFLAIFCILYDILFLDVQAEVNYLGTLSDPYLVKLVGYCLEDEQRLLVYEFMPRGSLENHLFRSKRVAFSSPSSLKMLFYSSEGIMLECCNMQGAPISSRCHGTYE